MLAKRYLPDASLKVYAPEYPPGDDLFCPFEEAAGCDAVILAVPISAYQETLSRMRPHLRPNSVVIDIATVKKHTMDLLQAAEPPVQFLSMHPMFGA